MTAPIPAAVTCRHHYCLCMRAAELAAMGRLPDAVKVHTDGLPVRCRMEEKRP